MQYNHIKIPLALSQQTIQVLKEQFALVVQAIESNQSVRFNEIMPLCDLMSQVIQEQSAFMDVLSNQLKTGEFFALPTMVLWRSSSGKWITINIICCIFQVMGHLKMAKAIWCLKMILP